MWGLGPFRALSSVHGGISLPRTSWIPLLSIARRYDISYLRDRAIDRIFGAPPPESGNDPQLLQLLVSVVEEFDLPLEHLVPWLIALVERPNPLTEDEVALFSVSTRSRLAHAREVFARIISNDYWSSTGRRREAEDIVNTIWGVRDGSNIYYRWNEGQLQRRSYRDIMVTP